MDINSLKALRVLYASARERSVRKELPALDPHCTHFIGLSPLVILASHSKAGLSDA